MFIALDISLMYIFIVIGTSKLRSFGPKSVLKAGVAFVLVLPSGIKFHITNLPQGHF